MNANTHSLKTIEIGGKQYYYELNMLALEEFLEEQEGLKLSDIESYIGGGSVRKMFKLVHFAIQYGHRIAKEPLTLTLEEMGMMIGWDMSQVEQIISKIIPDLDQSKKASRQPKSRKA